MMKGEVERAIQRTKRYWYEDGLVEAAVGVAFLLIGLLFYVDATAAPGSLPSSFSALALPLLIIGGGELGRRVVLTLKQRITYPRTGYVAYPRSGRRSGALAVVSGLVVAALVVLLVATQPVPRGLVPALQGIVIGAAMAWLGITLGLGRFFAIAGLSALIGLGAAFLGLGDTLGSAAYFALAGLALLVSGTSTLVGYLGHTQPAES